MKRSITRPRDSHSQARARHSNRYAVALVLMLGLSLAYAVTVNILSTVPATSCLPIAGGEGCGPSDSLIADHIAEAAGAAGTTSLMQHVI